MTSTRKLHGYTYTLMDPQPTQYKMPDIGSSLATGKYCTYHDTEVNALEQGAQAVIDLTDTNSEDVVLPTDYRTVYAQIHLTVDGPPVLTGCAYVRSNKSTFLNAESIAVQIIFLDHYVWNYLWIR